MSDETRQTFPGGDGEAEVRDRKPVTSGVKGRHLFTLNFALNALEEPTGY